MDDQEDRTGLFSGLTMADRVALPEGEAQRYHDGYMDALAQTEAMQDRLAVRAEELDAALTRVEKLAERYPWLARGWFATGFLTATSIALFVGSAIHVF